MSDVNTWMTTTAGCLVLAWVLHDIFRTLARPGTQGLVSRAVLRPVWRMSRHRRRASMAGPVAMLGVIAIWGLFVAALLVIGSIPLLVGLAIVVPVLGHATWHLYRKAVGRTHRVNRSLTI